MDLGSLLVLLKLALDSGFTVSPKTNGPTAPPPSEIKKRPDCGPGKKAVLDYRDEWVCISDLK